MIIKCEYVDFILQFSFPKNTLFLNEKTNGN